MSADSSQRLRSRFRLVAACALLVGLAMIQSPGLLVADTKFDLVVDPAGFLGRATHLWDPVGAFGQLQNQAYGYLWPMGPFFLLGDLVHLDGWFVQRLWLALVLVVAMTGAAKLARALGVRSDLACLVGGFAYALSPRMLTVLGPISIEAWPSALAPWVLLPLVIGSTRGSARRAAALSALAVAMVGGVNAAATVAVLPLGVVWLLTRSPGPRRRTMMWWWPAFTALGTLWWLVPLVLMGAYSPPFLDYIESAAVTTFPTTIFDALRGTSNWVPYVDPSSRAGNDLLRDFYLPINSGFLLFVGAAGIMMRRNPHRLFLALSVSLGLFLVTMGHLGDVQGWFAGGLRGSLDGVLAPVRNVHKFDPIVRLPLVMGLALLVDRLLAELRRETRRADTPTQRVASALRRVNRYAVVGAAVVAVLGASLPAVAGRITPSNALTGLPDYWTQAADWLDQEPGTALLLPGSSFGDYVWGSPQDEPMQMLAASPWAVRNAIPLTPPGNIRMLDAIEDRMAQGEGSTGLATYLTRAGVTHLVVRNDLSRDSDIPDPVLVHQALAQSPGLTRVATFGPDIGGEAHLDGLDGSRVLVNGGWQNDYPAIEIFAVDRDLGPAVISDELPVVVGGPEDLLDLADLGVVGDEPTQLATDVSGTPPAGARLVLTDGMRDVERNFGRIHDATSAVRAVGEARRMPNRARDYLIDDDDRWATTATLSGARAVTASSSMSDANASGTVQRGELPSAAVDGRTDTAWQSSSTEQPSWWQVDLDTPQQVVRVTVTAGPLEREVVQVRTTHAVSPPVIVNPGASRTIVLRDQASSFVRVEDASGAVGHRMTLTEVGLSGLAVERSLQLPVVPEAWGNPDDIVLRAVRDARTGCVTVDGAVRCVAGRDMTSEEPDGFSRRFGLADPGAYVPDLRVSPVAGKALDRLLLRDQLLRVGVSSEGSPDPRGSALAAIDGDDATTWTASLADVNPRLRLRWLDQRRVRGLDLSVAEDTAARLPNLVTVVWPGGRFEVPVRDGRVRFPTITTDRLTIRVDEADPSSSLGYDAVSSPVPVGVTELEVLGLPYVPLELSEVPVRYDCGTGPTLTVGDDVLRTAVVTSPADILAGAEARAEVCDIDTLDLPAGETRLDLAASDTFTPTSLVLHAADSPPAAVATTASVRPVPLTEDGPDRRTVDPDGSGGVLSVKQNVNPGWVAAQGSGLEEVVVDGWQQGWRIEDPDRAVALTFGPDAPYRVGLFVGLLAWCALVLLAARPGRRRDDDRPALAPAALPVPVLGLVAVVVGGVLAGWIGALVAAVAFVVAAVVTRVSPVSAPWLLAFTLVPAAAAYAVLPWGDASGWAGDLSWPHYLVVAVCSAFFAVVDEPRRGPGRDPGRRRWMSRMPGFSTRR